MSTPDCLFWKFQSTAPSLEIVAKEYFPHLSRAKVLEKARTQSFPFPCFRLDKSQKAPYFVHIKDLAEVLDRQHLDAASVSY